jgi:hypothetical protein
MKTIVTLMDYDDPEGVFMCKGWLHLARRFNPDARIVILHHEKDAQIRSFAADMEGVEFERLDLSAVMPAKRMNGHTFYCQDLTFARWVALERMAIQKYIFVEADAWILSDLSEWWEAADDKPFIAVAEDDRIDGYFNIGAFSHNSPTPFVTYKLLMDEYALAGDQIPIPIGDQGLLNIWAWRTRYNASHPSIGKTWNCPTYDRMDRFRMGRCDDNEIEVWCDGERVRILHTWGPRKWRDTPELAPITRYVETKILTACA